MVATVRSPSRNTPSAGLIVDALAGLPACGAGVYPFDPRLPDLLGSVASGISPVTVAGAAAFQAKSKRI
jgi:hypothetical protein